MDIAKGSFSMTFAEGLFLPSCLCAFGGQIDFSSVLCVCGMSVISGKIRRLASLCLVASVDNKKRNGG
ncbi:MAG: hypothetical protein MRJ65_02935 [Candidatus Brocadiaceae bacterium]|nr:hypothetical protein [Candidatus Brocadiaceae bacterium]